MVGDLGDFLLKQEEVGEQEREDLVMWLHQVSAINIHMHQPNPYHISMFIEDVVACMQSSLPLCSSEEKSNFCRCARRRQFRLRSSALRSTVSTGQYSPYPFQLLEYQMVMVGGQI